MAWLVQFRNTMTPLALAPLPSSRADGDAPSWQAEQLGFVDEAIIAKLLSPARIPRVSSCPDDLILAADDLDFAGWQLAPAASPFRGTEDMAAVSSLSERRATPPEMLEPGIGSPHRGNHRWWLAGLAGALSTLLFTLLLLILSSRPGTEVTTSPVGASPQASPSQTRMPASPDAADASLADSRR